jgi:hypothetical protein
VVGVVEREEDENATKQNEAIKKSRSNRERMKMVK